MSVEISTAALLLDSLVDNPNIKAAVLVDDQGYILEQRGNAHSIRGAHVGSETLQMGDSAPRENVYLVQAGSDFLIVVFDERLNFERLKRSVDSTLANFDLAPAVEE